MSCGLGEPEIRVSPFFTKSPSCTSITLVLGIRYSTASPSSGTIAILRLALYSRTNSILPEILAMTDMSLGRRASNSSATRGRPPVMSRVLAASRGTGKDVTRFDLLVILDRKHGARRQHVTRGSFVPASLNRVRRGAGPRSSCGRSHFGTTRWAMPVASSTRSSMVVPSIRSWYFTTPEVSVMIGRLNGSHSARRSPSLTFAPSLCISTVPYGTLWISRSRPSASITASSPLRASDRIRPFLSVMVGMSR